MEGEKATPTEREWLLMEAIWDSAGGLTSAEILTRVRMTDEMTDRTERVLLHHLCKKGLVRYTVDEHDSRVYHYFANVTREECLEKKRKEFVDTYYRGSEAGAVASFLGSMKLSDEQVKELEKLLTKSKKKGKKKHGK